MPIAFPRATGPTRSYIESQWLRLKTKCFDAVPAPNMGRPGAALNQINLGLPTANWSLDPGIGVSPVRATNVRRLSTMYQAPDQTSRPNPAAAVTSPMLDETSGYNKVMGDLNNRIVGVSRDAAGSPLGNCVVKVYRTEDDSVVATVQSDGSGNWTAYPNAPGPYYYVEYKAGSPDVFGTSPNTNTATVFTPGG